MTLRKSHYDELCALSASVHNRHSGAIKTISTPGMRLGGSLSAVAASLIGGTAQSSCSHRDLAGASGITLGAAAVAKADPDGNPFLIMADTRAFGVELNPNPDSMRRRILLRFCWSARPHPCSWRTPPRLVGCWPIVVPADKAKPKASPLVCKATAAVRYTRCCNTARPPQRPWSTAFLQAAVTHYASLGVMVQRNLNAYGSAIRSKRFKRACELLGLKHRFTRPHRLLTNCKAERLIQSALREWAYGVSYRRSSERTAMLKRWTHHFTTGTDPTKELERLHLSVDSGTRATSS